MLNRLEKNTNLHDVQKKNSDILYSRRCHEFNSKQKTKSQTDQAKKASLHTGAHGKRADGPGPALIGAHIRYLVRIGQNRRKKRMVIAQLG
jgi:ribosome-binding protein aMBF1 (putative translation factor)